MTSYLENLRAAYEFTEGLGASFTRLSEVAAELLTAERVARVQTAFKHLGIDSFSGAAGQCVKWSHALRPVVEEALGVPTLLTFGQVWANGRQWFNPSLADLDRWFRTGFSVTDLRTHVGMNLHAWWTVPSGEVLDVTLYTTLAKATRKAEWVGAVTGGRPDGTDPRYVPMVVGDDYIETVARHMPLSCFLAKKCTPAELDAESVMAFET